VRTFRAELGSTAIAIAVPGPINAKPSAAIAGKGRWFRDDHNFPIQPTENMDEIARLGQGHIPAIHADFGPVLRKGDSFRGPGVIL
jgi:hypothetical protein